MQVTAEIQTNSIVIRYGNEHSQIWYDKLKHTWPDGLTVFLHNDVVAFVPYLWLTNN